MRASCSHHARYLLHQNFGISCARWQIDNKFFAETKYMKMNCLSHFNKNDWFFFRFELSLPWPKIILLRTIKKLTIQNNISNLHLLDHQFSLPRCLPLVRNIILLKWLSPLIVFVCVCVRVNDEIWRIYIGRWDGWFFFLFFTFVVCKKRCCLRIFELRNSGCRCVFACMRVYGFYECNK